MIQCQKYDPRNKRKWDQLVTCAKNSSFLFYRDFMEYHADRFEDFSIVVWDDLELIALMPGNVTKTTVHSHQGLTYGGIVLKEDITFRAVLEIFTKVLEFLNQNGLKYLDLKPIPRIYNSIPSDELDWALSICRAKLYRRDSTIAINNSARMPYQKRRIRSINKCRTLNHDILNDEGSSGFIGFWEKVLIPNLKNKFKIDPVHSSDEIIKLATLFPDNIKQYNIYHSNEIMAGVTLFLNKSIVHAQYIAGTMAGKRNGSLDYLIDHLVSEFCSSHAWFDFGTCNEQQGTVINHGLLDWKEGFGARAITQDYYILETESYKLLHDKF
jgi:hypothetical protein